MRVPEPLPHVEMPVPEDAMVHIEHTPNGGGIYTCVHGVAWTEAAVVASDPALMEECFPQEWTQLQEYIARRRQHFVRIGGRHQGRTAAQLQVEAYRSLYECGFPEPDEPDYEAEVMTNAVVQNDAITMRDLEHMAQVLDERQTYPEYHDVWRREIVTDDANYNQRRADTQLQLSYMDQQIARFAEEPEMFTSIEELMTPEASSDVRDQER